MLQWMGGSRRKVTTSRKSTQKRQKQYFEQRKRQQQNLQITGPEGCSDIQGISGQCLKEHRSLDILNLLNLSTKAQECDFAFLKAQGRANVEANISAVPGNIMTNQPPINTGVATSVESCRIEEARAPFGCQIEAPPKEVLVSADDYQNDDLTGKACKPSDWKAVTDQHLGSSVLDLLYDDGPNVAVEECPTFEDHVAFSLEGLGKVGTETPVHTPQQLNRIPYGYTPSLKGGKKKMSKDVNHVLEDIELELDTMMDDIRVAPIRSFSNFPYNEGKQSLATAQDYKHFNDHDNKNGSQDYKHVNDHATKIGSSISQEFFFNSENNNDNIWNVPSSSFHDEKFDNEREYNASRKKKTFQRGISSMDLLKSGACKLASYASEDRLPKKRSSAAAAAMEGFDMIELPASYFKHQSENDYDFFVSNGARCSRSDGNFNVQSLVPEDVRDNSSLLSEESCSSTAVRGEVFIHSPSRSVTGENSKENKYAFASPGNKCRSKEVKFTSLSNSSKRKPSHYSNSILVEELGAHNSRQFKERYASANINSGDTLFCQNLEAEFEVFGSNNRTEDPLSIFTTPEFHDKPSPSFSGLKNGSNVAGSPPSSFTPEKFAFGDSSVFSDFRSWPTNPSFSPTFELKGNQKDVAGFHSETLCPDLSVQGSLSKDELKGKVHQDSLVNFELTEEIFMENKGWSTEKKMVGDTSTSSNCPQDCEGEKDPNVVITQSLETIGHVEEISSSPNKPDKNERKLDKTNRNNCDAEIPVKYKIANEDMENWQSEESNMATRKHNKKRINLSSQDRQVMFESYVFQLLYVQKILM